MNLVQFYRENGKAAPCKRLGTIGDLSSVRTLTHAINANKAVGLMAYSQSPIDCC